MTRVLRLLTLVVSFAALQLTLLGGGPGCALPVMRVAHRAPGAARATAVTMAGMDMTDPSGPAHAPADTSDTGHLAAGPAHAAPCEASAAPRACPTMAPCLFAVVLPSVRRGVPTVIGAPSPVAVLAVVRTPPSETPAPELPPPRA